MNEYIKPICNNCGHKSFRFSKKKGESYCLTCGEPKKIPRIDNSSIVKEPVSAPPL